MHAFCRRDKTCGTNPDEKGWCVSKEMEGYWRPPVLMFCNRIAGTLGTDRLLITDDTVKLKDRNFSHLFGPIITLSVPPGWQLAMSRPPSQAHHAVRVVQGQCCQKGRRSGRAEGVTWSWATTNPKVDDAINALKTMRNVILLTWLSFLFPQSQSRHLVWYCWYCYVAINETSCVL